MKIIASLLFLFITLSLFAVDIEVSKIVDTPTAGIVQKGNCEIFTKIYKDNGLLLGTNIGILPRFMIGLSYGGEQLVGNQEPVWHKKVEVNAKYRLLDESPKYPAVAIGFDSQGHGTYYEDNSRYDIKSKGFYGVLSKNFFLLGNIGLHAGLNYSLEDKETDDDINFFFGMDKSVGETVLFFAEYDPALNDNENRELNNKEHGFMNMGISLKVTDSFFIKLSAYDLLESDDNTHLFDRAVSVSYMFDLL